MPNPYSAPLPLMRLALNQASEHSGAAALSGYTEILTDLAEPVLDNAARFAGEVLSPLNPVGDRTPSRREAQGVVTPPGFVDAYRRFREDGWVSLGAPAEYGGQGLPTLLAAAVTEMWGGANLAFGMCPELTLGALEALQVHGSAELIGKYASRLASGEWTSAMCLTEPQAGSDLALIRTRAVPQGGDLAVDEFRLFGQKIFITWGEHDLTDNIIHLVLAKLPNAPPGVRGISLFVVPKFLVDDDTGVKTRNSLACGSIEHKMGIKASSTCVMNFDGATGWLCGEPHKGLKAMFTMMNTARLGVGIQGLGLAETAYQSARLYATDRLQGRALKGAKYPERPADPLLVHPDVRRMLLTVRSYVEGGRALAAWIGKEIDVSHKHPRSEERRVGKEC